MRTTTPNPSLMDILLPSLLPCSGFSNACRGYARWDPRVGYVPRGYIGGTDTINEIQLVLVTAEPGDPADGEDYDGPPAAMSSRCSRLGYGALQHLNLRRNGRAAPFHRNLRFLIDLCLPGRPFDEQMRRTWITPAVLCSATRSGAGLPQTMASYCGTRYLRPQIDAISSAFVIALGGKAVGRLRKCGARYDFVAQHPSARPNTNPEASWRAAAEAFQKWQRDRR